MADDQIQERNITENWNSKAQIRSFSDEQLGEFQEMQKMKVALQRSLGMLSTSSEEQQKVRSSTMRKLQNILNLLHFLSAALLFHM